VSLSPEALKRAREIAEAAPPLSDAVRQRLQQILHSTPAGERSSEAA